PAPHRGRAAAQGDAMLVTAADWHLGHDVDPPAEAAVHDLLHMHARDAPGPLEEIQRDLCRLGVALAARRGTRRLPGTPGGVVGASGKRIGAGSSRGSASAEGAAEGAADGAGGALALGAGALATVEADGAGGAGGADVAVAPAARAWPWRRRRGAAPA